MLRIFRVFVWVLGILLLLGIATLTTVDRSPVQDRSSYQSTIADLDTSTLSSST